MQLHKTRAVPLPPQWRTSSPTSTSEDHPRAPLKPIRGREGFRWSKKDWPYSHALRRGLRCLISALRSPPPNPKEWGCKESLATQNTHHHCLSEHRSHLSAWRAMLGWQGPAHGLTWQSGAADGAGRGSDLGLLLSTLCSRQGWLFRLLV